MKIAVALSGGVDSTAVALRLKQAGHEVFGITMRICPDLSALAAPGPAGPPRPGLPDHGCAHCAAPCACVDATSVAQELGIPLEMVDWRGAFETRVIEPFIGEFLSGRTPNPCTWCNREMKFGLMRDRALALGADAYATGHYVRLETGADGLAIRRALDPARDQTYFLSLVPARQFDRVMFPLGESFKTENQGEVKAAGVHAVPPITSNEICFLKDTDYAAFIRYRRPEAFRRGEIVDVSGKVLGVHSGLPAYTIGQRRGLGVAAPEALYVVRLEAETNRVVAGPDAELWTSRVSVRAFNWLAPAPAGPFQALAQIRYRQTPVPANVDRNPDGGVALTFEKPVRAVTPGQVAALYDGDRLLGGGIME